MLHSVIDSDCEAVYCFAGNLTFACPLYSQYALLLSYFQYCLNVVDPDVPTSVLHFLLLSEQDNEYIDLPKVQLLKHLLITYNILSGDINSIFLHFYLQPPD